jgi:hypothetical protein
MPAQRKKITTVSLRERKGQGDKIVAVTAYDVAFARLADRAGVDIVLVGDSLGMVVQGLSSTLPVTLDEMVYHSRAAARGVSSAHLVVDMPFMSYQASVEDGMRAAGRLLKEGGAEAVKLEGGEEVAELVRRLVSVGIPVMGHVGMTPQSVHKFGGFKLQGRTEAQARTIVAGARAIADAGRLRHGAGEYSGGVGRGNHRGGSQPHHRHRRRAFLRRPGAGHARPARAGPRLVAALCPPLRRIGAHSGEGIRRLRCRRARRTVSVEEGIFLVSDVPVIADLAAMSVWSEAARAQGERIVLVPTMGALHKGHLSLLTEARRRAQRVVLSIFVNPMQFGPQEDLAKYPRDLAGDLAKAASVGCDLAFVPEAAGMYGPGYQTAIDVREVSQGPVRRAPARSLRGRGHRGVQVLQHRAAACRVLWRKRLSATRRSSGAW